MVTFARTQPLLTRLFVQRPGLLLITCSTFEASTTPRKEPISLSRMRPTCAANTLTDAMISFIAGRASRTAVCMLQMASELGSASKTPSQTKSENTVSEFRKLSDLIGSKNAALMLEAFAKETGTKSVVAGPITSDNFEQRAVIQRRLIAMSLHSDEIYQDISKQLHHYSDKSKGQRNATKVAYCTFTVAGFVPTIIAPLSSTAMVTTMFANGGPEQDKLLKEIYLGKLLERRRALVTEEITTALKPTN